MADALVIEVTAGLDEPERCNQAFTVAAAAVAAGVPVDLWLSGEAAWLALPGRAAGLVLEHATPLPELIGLLLELGTVTVCTQSAARRSITPGDLIPGIAVAGAATYVERVLREGAQALVY
ncbi:DsrE family protein [Kineosporia sp. J2-2]|uniref:DsrE family protein n=1 Tax=Kineosporia corallincola TaxID=2835133 RepID=A0ABS5TBR6_9ACTN|nr:DsrE family protein [Kineosporia corallincola]MBT0767651.1 DsrE family protein [Kineosporia corallincola]